MDERHANLTRTNESLKNETDGASVPKEAQVDFLLTLSVDGTMLSVALWLIFSLLLYGIRTKRFTRRSTSDFNGGIVFSFALLSPLLFAARLLGTILLITIPLYEPGHDGACATMFDINIALYVFAVVPVYVLLWLRQRVLYQHPLMKSINSKGMAVMSWLCLFLLILGGLGLIALYTAPDNITSGYHGCVAKTDGGTSILPNILTLVVMVLGQVMLLVLFVIPLRKQTPPQKPRARKRRMSERFLDGFRRVTSKSTWGVEIQSYSVKLPTNHNQGVLLRTATASTGAASPQHSGSDTLRRNTQKKPRTANRVRRILFRSVTFAAICITSDLLANGIVVFGIGAKYPKNLSFMVYDVSLFVNVLCIILSFDHFKFMILSPFCNPNKENLAVTELSSKQHSKNEGSLGD